jgi:hypothetical protein
VLCPITNRKRSLKKTIRFPGGGITSRDLKRGRSVPTDNTYLGTEAQPYDQFNYNIYGRTFYVTASYKAGEK